MDVWLKNEIKNSIKMIQNCNNNHVGTSKLYYTGHLQKDILEKLPTEQVKKYLNNFRDL